MIFCKYRFFRLFTYISTIYYTRVPIVRVRRLCRLNATRLDKFKIKLKLK